MPVVKCPQCGKMVDYNGNEFRPFCSERCKLLDLGAWADEEFAIPAETGSLSEEELRMVVEAVEENDS